MSDVVKPFMDLFLEMSDETPEKLADVYARDIEFTDPFHHINGLENLQVYFRRMMRLTEVCKFDFKSQLSGDGEAMVTWVMRLRHRKLKAGDWIELPGASHLRYDEKIHYHRDYFDAAALVYEHVPVLGATIRYVKGRV